MRRLVVAALSVGLVFLGVVEVSAQYPPGYFLEQTGTGFAALSSEQRLSLLESVKMGTVLADDRAAIVFNGGPRLNSINQLSYWTYTTGGGTFGQLTAWVAIYLHVQPNKTYADWVTDYLAASPDVYYLQAEPYYTTGYPVLNTWQLQNAFGASALKWESLESSGSPHTAPTLATYVAGAVPTYSSREYGTLYIAAVKIRMGYGGPWLNTQAYVDDVTLNDYFEKFGVSENVPALSTSGVILLVMLTVLASMFVLRRRP